MTLLFCKLSSVVLRILELKLNLSVMKSEELNSSHRQHTVITSFFEDKMLSQALIL